MRERRLRHNAAQEPPSCFAFQACADPEAMPMSRSRLMRLCVRCAASLAAALLGAGCVKNHTAYALTQTGTILQFQTNKPTKLTQTATVSGLTSGVGLVQIVYRPANQTLYCLTSDNHLCTVNPDTGAVALLGAAFDGDTLRDQVLAFDPVVDQVRLIASDSTAGSGLDNTNLRLSPTDGSVLHSGSGLGYASGDLNVNKTPRLGGLSYTNATAGASNATLYGLDLTTQSLVRVGDKNASAPASADNGALTTVGSLGVSFGLAGFDIETADNLGYAALTPTGSGAVLYTVDLDTGAATKIDNIGAGDRVVISLALKP